MIHYAGILDGSGSVWGVRLPDLPGVRGGGETPAAAIYDTICAAREWTVYALEIAAKELAGEIEAIPTLEFNR